MSTPDLYEDPALPRRGSEDDGGEGPQIPAFLLDPVGIVRRRWLWMLGTVILGLMATGVTAALWKPLYTARASVVISSQQIPEEFIRSTVGEDSISNIAAMIGKVISQENLGRILQQFDLYADERGEATLLGLISRMRSRIDISPESRPDRRATSMVYGVSFQDEDPAHAADVANALAALFVEGSMARRNEQAQRTTQFLKRELERDDRELREHSKRVSEFRRLHRGELPTELETNLRKRDLLAEEREALTLAISDKTRRIERLTTDPTELAPTENETLLDELRRQLVLQTTAHTDEHPNVVALRRRVAKQEELVAAERSAQDGNVSVVERMISDEKRELDRMRRRLADTEQEITDLSGRIDRTPAIGEELAALEQKEQILREDYLGTLRKVEEAELAESLESAEQGGRVSVLDAAQAPSSPAIPRALVVAGGVAVSLLLALAVAVLIELIDPVVVSTVQLEALAGGPLLGSLPRIG
jgi:succinoglycan biosynthesis transport protein ExoP